MECKGWAGVDVGVSRWFLSIYCRDPNSMGSVLVYLAFFETNRVQRHRVSQYLAYFESKRRMGGQVHI